MRRRLTVLLVVGSVFVWLGPGEAVGKSYDTTVNASYNYDQNKVSGTVTSGKATCMVGRGLTLYHQPGGNEANQKPAGTATTAADGSYEITPNLTPVLGDYWNIVAEQVKVKKGKAPDDTRDTLKPKKKKKDKCKAGSRRIPA